MDVAHYGHRWIHLCDATAASHNSNITIFVSSNPDDAAPVGLSEEEIANVQAEANDADLLSDANVEAEEDAIALHESSFAAAGTGESVGVRRSGARNARMPQMLQDYELRRPGRVRRL